MTPLSRYVVETLVTLLAVVALCVVLLSALRRVGCRKVGGPLELWPRPAARRSRAVYLVRAGETVYVVAASETRLAKLGGNAAERCCPSSRSPSFRAQRGAAARDRHEVG